MNVEEKSERMFARIKGKLGVDELREIDNDISTNDYVSFDKVGKRLFGSQFDWFIETQISLAGTSVKERLETMKRHEKCIRETRKQMLAININDEKKHLVMIDPSFFNTGFIKESVADKKLGRASMILCMFSAVYIAIIPETIFSSIAWIVYIFGAVTGIVHLNRVKDKSTMQMYSIWLILDIIAVTRLLAFII